MGVGVCCEVGAEEVLEGGEGEVELRWVHC